MSKNNIVFTGGGSGGHSVVAMTLIKFFRLKGVQNISYIGSHKGIEKRLCSKNEIPYYSISTGKLRRYFSFQNTIDFFKFIWGILQSFKILLTSLKDADIIFSTGGFVSVPAAISGKLLGKRVYLHEQTTRAGLANKIVAKLADKVFLSFDSSMEFFPNEKTLTVGYPLREEFQTKSLNFKEFDGVKLDNPAKKILFVTGGGNGAFKLNELIQTYLDELKKEFIVIHQTGKKFIDDYKHLKSDSYIPVSFIGDEFPDLLKSASLVICRAGAGTVSELMTINANAIFIPLKIAQKNEQYHNAVEALKFVNGKIVLEDDLEQLDLMAIISELNLENSGKEFSPSQTAELIFQKITEAK